MRVMELLDREAVDYEVDLHEDTYTAGQLAAVERVRRNKVVKPVVVEADGEFVMCALPANRRVDLNALRTALHASDVHLAAERQVQDLCSDCEMGAEPPIGRLFGLKTIMDDSIRNQRQVVFQGGTHGAAIRMSEPDFERVARPNIARFARRA